MKTILRLEYLMLFFAGLWLFSETEFTWWWFPALFFVSDISMLGYLFGTKTGAVCYNAFHHFGIAIFCYIVGNYIGSDILSLAGLILFSHTAFDRVLGYGLKYPDDFKNTHLGRIGK